jgi:hypothetical protein
MRRTIFLAGAAIALALGGCASNEAKPVAAPPPVPLHPQIAWDRALRVHVLVDTPGYYLHDGHYVRFREGAWETAEDWAGPWRAASPAEVPDSLARRHAKARTPSSEQAPAKKAW